MVIKNTYILYFKYEHYLSDNVWMKVYEAEIDGKSRYFSENEGGKLSEMSAEFFKSTIENTNIENAKN